MKHLPKDPGVYVFRDERGRPLYVGKSVSLRTRAGRGALLRPGGLDRARLGCRLPAHELGAGGAGAGEPADQAVAPTRQQGAQANRQVGLRAVPAGRGVPRAGSLGPAGLGARREHRTGARQEAGGRAGRPPDLALQAAPLRPLATTPPRAPLDLRPDGPLLLALPGRPRPQRLPRPGGEGAGPVRARARGWPSRCWPRSTRAWRGPRASDATSAPPPCCVGASGWRRYWGASMGCCARSTPTRGWCWPATRYAIATTRSGWSTAAWPTGARCPSTPTRWRAAAGRCWTQAKRAERTSVPAEDVDEVRIASAWMAEHRPPELALVDAVDAGLGEAVRGRGCSLRSSTPRAPWVPSPHEQPRQHPASDRRRVDRRRGRRDLRPHRPLHRRRRRLGRRRAGARTPGRPPTPRLPPSASGRPRPRRPAVSRYRRPPRCCASGRRTSPRS